ncbi:hypothetical protein [Aquimarina agarivorans]|uniref:hypothetical protein n=1 Tax=Aquimarina agarivorans TaxID=980584 RepID=UPI000248E93F|nr:hypothetical protein [Aquimarina agarivorans]
MAILRFDGFLPNEETPEEFELFRKVSSECFKKLEGDLTFYFVESYKRFDIKTNTTGKNYTEIRNMLDDYSYLLM